MSSISEDNIMEYETDHVSSNDVGIQATPSQFNAEVQVTLKSSSIG